MNKLFAIVALGLAGGIFAHFSWLHYRQPVAQDDLDAQLAWIRHDLQLSPEQYAHLKEIHQQSSARLVALSSRVSRMKDELAAFEQQRQTTGEIDFLEFAQFIEMRRAIDHECLQSTRQLVDASTGLMNEQQRFRYLQLLPLADRPSSAPVTN